MSALWVFSSHGSLRVKTNSAKCHVKTITNTALSAVTLFSNLNFKYINNYTQLTWISLYTSLINYKYVIDGRFDRFTTRQLQPLYSDKKWYTVYFMKWLENTRMPLNCLWQYSGFYYLPITHVRNSVLGTTHWDCPAAVKMLTVFRIYIVEIPDNS